MEKNMYVAPEVEIVEVAVEKGFASSDDVVFIGISEDLEVTETSSRGWSHGW